MCGIAVVVDPELGLPKGRKLCQDAVQDLIHRGPDDNAVYCIPPAFVGHCRLAVIDPKASRQPMADPSGRYVLAYNGTTYNYKELRSGLRGRWHFATTGDTEVVLAGLVLEGPGFLKKMRGMAAGVLWDDRRKRMLLFRDRLGQKPLYYLQHGRRLAVASEIGALLKLTGIEPAHDQDSTADFFRYGFCLPGTTFYKGIREILAGHFAWWRPAKTLQQEAYWSLPGRIVGSDPRCEVELRRELKRAVLDRLVADVPVALFLSGGVDSSLIAAICARSGRRLSAFTLGFRERDFDERPFAAKVARLFCDGYREALLPGRISLEQIKSAMDNLGQPFGDPSLLGLTRLAEVAAKQVKVALGGDGGDELFGGYQRYRARVFMCWYSRLPRRLRECGRLLIRSLPEPMAHHSRSLIKKAHLFLDMMENTGGGSYVAPRLFSERQLERLLPGMYHGGHRAPGLPETSTDTEDLERMLAADLLVYLPQDICCKSDRATMAHGLEFRAPFLDHRLVEAAMGLAPKLHVGLTGGKRQLRRVMGDFLPGFIWRRNKQGFFIPLHRWFTEGPLGQALRGLAVADFGPLDRNYVLELLAQHQSGARDRSLQLWAVWSYLSWL